jgi:hypothetical protein
MGRDTQQEAGKMTATEFAAAVNGVSLADNETKTIASVQVAGGLWAVVQVRVAHDWNGAAQGREVVLSCQDYKPRVEAPWVDGLSVPDVADSRAWARRAGAYAVAALVGGENICGTVVVR